MSTALDLINQARRLLADYDDKSFSDDAMLAYLNEGAKRFAAETHCCQIVKDYTFTGATTAFSVFENNPVDEVLSIVQILVKSADGSYFLPKAPITETKNHLPQSETMPTRYSVFGKLILLDTYAGKTISVPTSVFFTYIPKTLNSTDDIVLIPGEWEQALVRYMVFCAHLSMRDAGLANGAYEEYKALAAQAAALTIAKVN